MSTADPFVYALTAARRRAVCFHEAGHAIVHALGGAFVYRVAVAPEGSTDWTTSGRKGDHLTDLWGVCSASDSPAGWFFRKHDDYNGDVYLSADRRGWRAFLKVVESDRIAGKAMRREQLRQIRAHCCALLAGPAAEQIHLGEEPWLDVDGEHGAIDDAKLAQAHAWLLPWRGELDHLHALTVSTLRTPWVWQYVQRLADELERVGEVEDQVHTFLPDAIPGWPSSSRQKAAPMVAPTVRVNVAASTAAICHGSAA